MPSLLRKPVDLLERAADELSHVRSGFDLRYASANRLAIMGVIHDLQKAVFALDKDIENGDS